MARQGGYQRNVDGIEWVKVDEVVDAEGKISARTMGQDYYTWLNDAITHHVYRCDQLQAQQLYRADKEAFDAGLSHISPQPYDPKYQVNRPKPEITHPTGQGSAAARTGRNYKP